jgi:excisionase family DNA binding protein
MSESQQIEDRLLTREEAAAYLGVRPQTLSVWHSERRYNLPVVKVGRLVKYRLSDLRAWVESRRVPA